MFSELSRFPVAVPGVPPSCVCLDVAHELVCIGFADGFVQVVQLYPEMQVVSRFKAQKPGKITQMLACFGVGVFSLGQSGLRIHTHFGLPVFAPQHAEDEVLSCFAMSGPSHIIVGSEQGSLFVHNFASAQQHHKHAKRLCSLPGKVGVSSLCAAPRGAMACGTATGSIFVIDARTGSLQHELKTGGGRIDRLAVSNDVLVSTGFTLSNATRREPFVKVFDLRTQRQLKPIQVPQSAVSLCFIPALGSTILVASVMGYIWQCDVKAGDLIPMPASMAGLQVVDLAVSVSGQIAVCVSADGQVLVMASSFVQGEPRITGAFAPLVEIPPPPPFGAELSPCPGLPYWMDNDLALPIYYNTFANDESCAGGFELSALPDVLMDRPLRPRPPLGIHPDLLAAMQSRDNVGWILNQANLPGNALLFGKKHHDAAYVDPDLRAQRVKSDDESDGTISSEEATEHRVPSRMSRRRLKLSRHGLVDYDFSKRNATQFSGLEGDVPNSYVNPVLQLLYGIRPFRLTIVPFWSPKPLDLASETAFVFKMLDLAREKLPNQVKSVQARNFAGVLKQSPDALALGLIEPTKLDMERRAPALMRFLLTQIASASRTLSDKVESLFGVPFKHLDLWQGASPTSRESKANIVDLVYPSELGKAHALGQSLPPVTFVELLTGTLKSERRTRAWCEELKSQVPVVQIKCATSLPTVLLLGCAGESKAHMEPWRSPGFLPMCWKADLDSSSRWTVQVIDRPVENAYELRAVISQVRHGKNDEVGHLILHLRVNDEPGMAARSVPGSSWVLFNNVIVKPTTKISADVLSFTQWKTPAMLVYERVGVQEEFVGIPRVPLTQDVFLSPSLAVNKSTHIPPARIPGQGDLVAIDCEFVALSTDESELLADGSRLVVVPSHLALARVSCLAADGVVIMDDYIVSTEPVVDYLTRFSGLVAGDLDPATSTHHLLHLKTVYLKLLFLIEQGCIFVGHGLDNDLRVCNLLIPPDQIRDTVRLYRLPGQRKLSLRFLTSVLLHEEIQDKVHDSIQDALASLRLYRLREELIAQGKWEEVLKGVYEEGVKRGF